jgi:hypothetical protein
MPRASTVVTLVLLGSALAYIGWSWYNADQDDKKDGQRSHGGYHGGHAWFWGVGRGYSGGSSSAPGAPSAPASGTVRGGFGGTGAAAAGAVAVGG